MLSAPVVGIEPQTFRVRVVDRPLCHTEYGEADFRLATIRKYELLVLQSKLHAIACYKKGKRGALDQKCEYDAHILTILSCKSASAARDQILSIRAELA